VRAHDFSSRCPSRCPSLLPGAAGRLRAYRDFFQLELFAAVGLTGSSSLFTSSEFMVSLIVLSTTSAYSVIDDK
jgi:hypothetical protein